MVKKPAWTLGSEHDPTLYAGPFRSNVTSFLENHGTCLQLTEPGVTAWTVTVRFNGRTAQEGSKNCQLYVYQEAVTDVPPVCDQCRIIGWQQHPVCTCRYHFIVPNQALGAPLMQPKQAVSEAAKVEDAAHLFVAPATQFDSSAHLLHGILHMNGFGHLLRVNGYEGGSTALAGRELMNIWDELCKLLHARKVSVEDVSSKAGMELRVLHSAAHQQTWYGKWGYSFGRGAFNISKKTWKSTVNTVHNTPMAAVLADFETCVADHRIPAIIERYQVSIENEPDPTTVGLFLRRLLFLMSKPDIAAGIMGVEEASKLFPARGAPDKRPRATPAPAKAKQAYKAPKQQKAQDTPARLIRQQLPQANGGLDHLSGRTKRKRSQMHDPSPPSAEILRASRRQKMSTKRWSPEASDELHDYCPILQGQAEEDSGGALQLSKGALLPLNLSKVHNRMNHANLKQAIGILVGLLKENNGQAMSEASLQSSLRIYISSEAVVLAALRVTANAIVQDYAIHRVVATVAGLSTVCFILDEVQSGDRSVPCRVTTTEKVLKDQTWADLLKGPSAKQADNDAPTEALAEEHSLLPAALDPPNPITTDAAPASSLPDFAHNIHPAETAAVGEPMNDSAQPLTKPQPLAEDVSMAETEPPEPDRKAEPQDVSMTAVDQPTMDAEAQIAANPAPSGPEGTTKDPAGKHHTADVLNLLPPSSVPPRISDASSPLGPAITAALLVQADGEQPGAIQEVGTDAAQGNASGQAETLPAPEDGVLSIEQANGLGPVSEAVKSGARPPSYLPAGPWGRRQLRSGRTRKRLPLLGGLEPGATNCLETAILRGSSEICPEPGVLCELQKPSIGDLQTEVETAGEATEQHGQEFQTVGICTGQEGICTGQEVQPRVDSSDAAILSNHAAVPLDEGTTNAATSPKNSDSAPGESSPAAPTSNEAPAAVALDGAGKQLPAEGPITCAVALDTPVEVPLAENGPVPCDGPELEDLPSVHPLSEPPANWSKLTPADAPENSPATASSLDQATFALQAAPPNLEATPSVVTSLEPPIPPPLNQNGPLPSAASLENGQESDPLPRPEAIQPQPVSLPEMLYTENVQQQGAPTLGSLETAGAEKSTEQSLLCPEQPAAQLFLALPVAAEPSPNAMFGTGLVKTEAPSLSKPAASPKIDRATKVVKAPAAKRGTVSIAKEGKLKKAIGRPRKSRDAPRQGTDQKRKAAAIQEVALPPVPAWKTLQPGAAFQEQGGAQPTDQVLCDLVYFFDCVLRCYHPAVAADLVPQCLMPAAGSVNTTPTAAAKSLAASGRRRGPGLRAARLMEHAALLMDTKHFLKDYTRPAGERNHDVWPLMMVQFPVMDFVSAEGSQSRLQAPGNASGKLKPAVKLAKKRRVVQPPVELIELPVQASSKQIKAAAEAAFHSMYVMLADYQIGSIENLPKSKGAYKVAKRLNLSTVYQATGDQESANADPQWHHAGGEEDWLVACKCGCRDDDGERMIACDSCGLWMHLRCEGIPDSAPTPDSFSCQRCKVSLKALEKRGREPEAVVPHD